MMLKNKYGFLLLIILCFGILVCSPVIDQKIAILPFDKTSSHFYGEVSLWCKLIYRSIPWITIFLVIWPIINWLFNKFNGDQASLFKSRKIALIILISLILGPGLIVNFAFKDNWGRPRPYQVIRDGKTYVPFWQPDFNENKDNSFPSGHASIGFFLGVPFLASGYRKRGLIVSCIGGFVVGMVRIMQGGHYLSDIIFAGIFVWGTAELVLFLVDKILKNKGYLGE